MIDAEYWVQKMLTILSKKSLSKHKSKTQSFIRYKLLYIFVYIYLDIIINSMYNFYRSRFL